jgi:hypothetical protein
MPLSPPDAPRSRANRDLLVLILSLLAAGCDLGETHRFANEGRVCVFPGGSPAASSVLPAQEPLSYAADAPLEVTVTLPNCLSGSCTEDRRAECTAKLEGNVIQVRSTASYSDTGSGLLPRSCTDDCRLLSARCSTGALPAGTYEIKHGATSMMVTLPSRVPPPCAGRGLGM